MAASPVPVLAQITFKEANTPLAKILELTDEKGNVSLFAIGPEGLSELLQEMLSLAARWGEFDVAAAREVSGGIPATDFQIGQGRDVTEGALLLHVGPVQLGFLLPSPLVLQRISDFSERVKLVPLGSSGTVQ